MKIKLLLLLVLIGSSCIFSTEKQKTARQAFDECVQANMYELGVMVAQSKLPDCPQLELLVKTHKLKILEHCVNLVREKVAKGELAAKEEVNVPA